MRSGALAADADRLEELDASGCFLGEIGLKFMQSLFMSALSIQSYVKPWWWHYLGFQQTSANKAVRCNPTVAKLRGYPSAHVLSWWPRMT